MSDGQLLSILIPAVGGQGGGVLAEWIVEAATIEGLIAHGTSIPGVAQRTGSTTYYVEVFAGRPEDEPVFSLYPIPGALDVLLAPEFLEVGRAIEQGVPSPGRTTIITSTHRVYSIHEKTATGHRIYPADRLEAAARAFSRAFIGFDALAVAREHDTEVNAVLLGALAASGALPVPPEAYRAAIERRGIQVAPNVKGFEVGLHLGGQRAEPPPEPLRPLRLPPLLAEAVSALPPALRAVAGEALARLVDYQDERYAGLYLERLGSFVGEGRDGELARLVARHLAVWMTYEDAIRVADLKTRRSRFERIRWETRAGSAELVVTDFLKPDLDELYGILPYRWMARFARWAERRWPHGRPTVGQRVRTTTLLGFLRLWLLARLRRFRPASYRFQREHERMERWLTALRQCAEWDRELAREVAQAARLVKGYGDVRRRMTALFDHLLPSVLQAASLDALNGGGFAVSTALAATSRRLVLQGPEHEDEARALASDVLAKLQKNDVAAALALLKSVA
ncbi:MAG: indolepyruvate oxidoreductase subunit beta family protein [Candidatus Rokubacteria bacterium]|nr:indolepyruvate oxidoreductase subunit beta family protein [Candidatus Rokubacteria bacterium]